MIKAAGFNIFLNNHKEFEISCFNNTPISLDSKDLEDLILYMQNPELYKDTKNFNL